MWTGLYLLLLRMSIMILNGHSAVGNLENVKPQPTNGVCAWWALTTGWVGGFFLGLVFLQLGLPHTGLNRALKVELQGQALPGP